MDHIHLPDPVQKDILKLKEENRLLQSKVEELQEKFENFIKTSEHEQGEFYDELGFQQNVCCIWNEVSKSAS
jgi:predicted RNase H-like nuclease (RuvC/YqgF family)